MCVIGFSAASQKFSEIASLYSQAQKAMEEYIVTVGSIIGYEETCAVSNGQENPNVYKYYKSYSRKMKDYIERHYMEEITTKDVAASVYLSSRYAHDCFRKGCGCTIFDYITKCRIDEAKRLLAEGENSVLTIACMVGYSGKTSFYLAFKRNVGMSPTEYRIQTGKI